MKLKTLLLLNGFFFFQTCFANDLQNKIPATAFFIFTVHGETILNKMPLAEMEKLSVVDAFIKKVTKDSNQSKLSEMGINLGSTSYFFVEMTDSVLYFNYIFPLSDADKFEKAFGKDRKLKKDVAGNKYIQTKDGVLTWNKSYGIIIYADAFSEYFNQSEGIYSRYGYSVEDEKEYTEETAIDSVVVAEPAPYDRAPSDSSENYDYSDETYSYDGWSLKQQYKDSIVLNWLLQKATNQFNLNHSASISTNSKFVQSQDKTAEGICWFGSNNIALLSLMQRFSGPSKMMFQSMTNSAFFSDKNYFVASLHCNEKEIKGKFTSVMDPRLSEMYAKITNAKLNKNFAKYIPSENLLGYYSIAYNTQALLEETPKFVKPYLEMIPYAKNVSSEIIDLYSLFLDEEALGKLFKGDGIFAITNLVTKEVEYSTYEYDSSYNYNEIKKFKNETFPEFVMMYSTEDVVMTEKLMGMFFKTGLVIKNEAGYYESSLYKGSPFKLYFMQKEGIVFLCNTQQQIEIILKGKVEKGLSKEQLKKLTTNSANMFVDIKKILERIPNDKDDIKKMNMLTYGRDNVSQISFVQSKPKDNAITSELTLNIPAGKGNSLSYLFTMINELYLMGK